MKHDNLKQQLARAVKTICAIELLLDIECDKAALKAAIANYKAYQLSQILYESTHGKIKEAKRKTSE